MRIRYWYLTEKSLLEGAKKTIAIDLDNVLADTLGFWCQLAQKKLKIKITKNDIPDPRFRGLKTYPRKKLLELLREIWMHWEEIPLLDKKAPQVINRLRNENYKVVVLSSRKKEEESYIRNWLQYNKILVDDLKLLNFSRRKKDYKKVDILIDDDVKEIKLFIKTGRIGIIYTQPWNQNVKIEKAYRIHNFEEIRAILLNK